MATPKVNAEAKVNAEEKADTKVKLSIEEKMKVAKENAEKIVDFLIPLAADAKDTQVSITINGYTWVIKRGVPVQVPQKVVDVYNQGQQQKMRTQVMKTRIAQVYNME